MSSKELQTNHQSNTLKANCYGQTSQKVTTTENTIFPEKKTIVGRTKELILGISE